MDNAPVGRCHVIFSDKTMFNSKTVATDLYKTCRSIRFCSSPLHLTGITTMQGKDITDSLSMEFQKDLFCGGDFGKQHTKRLIDKDGFALPAPGRIHKGKTGNQEKNQFNGENRFSELENNSQQVERETESGLHAKEDMTHFGNQPEMPSDKGAALQEMNTKDTVMDLMKNFIQDTSELQSDWSKIFSQSEEFELDCLQKIDMYTDKANSLESERERQKNALCHRIKGIGGILQNFE